MRPRPQAILAAAVLALAACGEESSSSADGDDAAEPTAARSSEPPRTETNLTLDTPKGAYPVIWVRAGEEVEVRTEPGGGEVVRRLDRHTEFGSPTVLGVVKTTTDGTWAAIGDPKLGNGRLGWVRLDPERLEAGWTKLAISVDLSDRRLDVLTDGEVTRSFAVTVGAPGSETPTGRFAVTDTFRGNLEPAYGCCALALSAIQPKLPSGWFGGNRIAIHGTAGPLGDAASHGCVRAADAEVSELIDTVPLGTPVFIRA